MGATTVIVAFDTYRELSLMNATRAKRQTKKVSRQYHITSSSNLSKLSMKDLLCHNSSKQSLSILLLESLATHLNSKSVNYALAGNARTICSFRELSGNNHKEGNTLIPYLLSVVPVQQNKAVVYATGTDIFVLLMRFRSRLPFQQIFLQTSFDECIDSDIIHKFLGEKRATALLSLHGITGCDTSGKFNYKSKEHWVKHFVKNSNDDDLLESLIDLQIRFKYSEVLEKFICNGYLRSKTTVTTLEKARWTLFKRSSAESQKLPPTRGAFEKHLQRSFVQINTWANACVAIIPVLDPLQFGWKREGNMYFPETTDDDIAPCSVINLISCQCKYKCHKRCGCCTNGLVCTDFCNCGDTCENTDPPISFTDVAQHDEEM